MKELTLEITNKCHQNCPWCSSGSTPDGEHTPVKKVVHLLHWYSYRKASETKNEKWCTTLRLSGGEPTLHPHLPDILSKAKDLGYYTILLTHGMFGHEVFNSTVRYLDEYWIDVVAVESLLRAKGLKGLGKKITLQVVLVKGNEELIDKALGVSLDYHIPLRLLVLQKQGRGINCEPLDLISWTGDKGCDKENKITVTHDGEIVTCSALKYGECSLRDVGI